MSSRGYDGMLPTFQEVPVSRRDRACERGREADRQAETHGSRQLGRIRADSNTGLWMLSRLHMHNSLVDEGVA